MPDLSQTPLAWSDPPLAPPRSSPSRCRLWLALCVDEGVAIALLLLAQLLGGAAGASLLPAQQAVAAVAGAFWFATLATLSLWCLGATPGMALSALRATSPVSLGVSARASLALWLCLPLMAFPLALGREKSLWEMALGVGLKRET